MTVRIIKGTKQIGGCITEISTEKSKIIIDFGNDLDDNSNSFELEGLTYGRSCYDAIFITHSHSDHIGLINKINKDIPIFIEDNSLKIHNLTCDFCNKEKATGGNIQIFKLNNNYSEKQEERPIFSNNNLCVYAYLTDHSSYNSCMYLIEGDGKRILHTGDFRMHGKKSSVVINSLKKIGNVDMLITEGTTLTRCSDKYMSEKELEDEAIKIMKKYNQVLIMQSSTNLDRTSSFIRASIRTNKKFIVDLFSYHLQNVIKRFFYVDNKRIYLWKPYKYKYKNKCFINKYMNIDNNLKGAFPYYVMEVKESMLIDIKKLLEKGLFDKTCLIYSMWDGYTLKEDKLKKFIEKLKNMNIDIYYLHTSGHADKLAFKKLNELVNPKKTIIIHTEDGSGGKELFNNVISIRDNESVSVN